MKSEKYVSHFCKYLIVRVVKCRYKAEDTHEARERRLPYPASSLYKPLYKRVQDPDHRPADPDPLLRPLECEMTANEIIVCLSARGIEQLGSYGLT